MTQRQLRWHQPLSFLAIAGVLCLSSHSASAQLRPIADDSLGNERSLVTPFNPAIDLIDGGARRGGNLFHSFREFNVDVGRGVYFTNPVGVANILTRVTGGNPSQILGTLGVLGNANLFLLNPNGILFGPNAQLDFRGGSFVASTANSLVFNNGFTFSATNPQAPPLLTINVPIGLQYGRNPGAIQVQGSFLQVPDGQTLTLAGGAVNIDGAGLFALGGRVELAGVGDAGMVGLAQQGQEWRLNVPEGLARADVAIGNNAIVRVTAVGGGSITVIARNLTGTGTGTVLEAGIGTGSGAVDAQAGDIDINATEVVSLDASRVLNAIFSDGIGNTGDIRITTGSLSLTNGGLVLSGTSGQGDAGNIIITARDTVSFDGVDINGFSSAAATQVSPGAIGQGGDVIITTDKLFFTNGASAVASTFGQGDAGNIAITTGTLALTNGSQMVTSTRSQGDAGDITIVARDGVSFDGVSSNGFLSGAYSNVGNDATGQGGNISITTGMLSITNGAVVNDITFGQGNAGNITITAGDTVSIDGVDINGANGGVYGGVASGAIGQGGDIRITTGKLYLTNGGYINASTFGQGNAGNITITARDTVSIDSEGSNGFGSSILSSVSSEATGRGGDITITADSLSFTNGGTVSNSTLGRGNAGDLTLTAKDTVSFDGTTKNLQQTSGAGSTVEFGAIGRGGNISISTGILSITNGAAVSATTFGQGNAGTVTVTAKDAVFIDGADINGIPSGIFSRVGSGGIGQGGKLTVNTGLFSITNRGELTASSEGQGDAGNLDVNARQLRLDNQGSIQAQTRLGQGGNITLQVQDYLLLRRGSSISTTAGTAQAGGNGGNITFKGNFIVAVPNENSDISANAFTGSGGRVNINAQGIFGIQFRPQLTPLSDITASSDFGVAGVVAINTPDVDPSRGLLQLPVDLTDASRLIVQTCPTGDSLAKQPNEFIITGRGGLPPNPSEAVNRDAIQVDLVTVDAGDRPSVSQTQPDQVPPLTLAPDAPIVEAQTLERAADGTMFLVAAIPNQPIDHFPDRLMHCR